MKLKKLIGTVLSVILVCSMFTGCVGKSEEEILMEKQDNPDIFVGKYIAIGDYEGTLEIRQSQKGYSLALTSDYITLQATGQLKNGSLVYEGKDEERNDVYGTIEEYGADRPLRMEIYGDYHDFEIEFVRQNDGLQQ